jgi:phage-related protein
MPPTRLIFYREGTTVPLLEWMRTLPAKVQDKCLAYLGHLENLGYELRRPVADYLRDGIHELRTSYQGIQYRILYFFPKSHGVSRTGRSQVVVVSHGIVKDRSVPDDEIERALRRKGKFEENPREHIFNPGGKEY